MRDVRTHSVSVTGIVVNGQDQVLIIQRRDNGHWEPPGGLLEPEETFEQGVQREVQEETGLRVSVGRLTGVYKNLRRGIVALVYRCAPLDGDLGPSEETKAVRWASRDEVEQLMDPAYAIRVLDALTSATASRAHDGTHIIER